MRMAPVIDTIKREIPLSGFNKSNSWIGRQG